MTPAAILSAHAWNSITGRCACGGWEGNRVDHGAHQIEQLGAAGWNVVQDRKLLGQANYLLARIVSAANLGAIDGADGFVESYNLPTGPIHKAIPFLQEQGIVVTTDGQIQTCPHPPGA